MWEKREKRQVWEFVQIVNYINGLGKKKKEKRGWGKSKKKNAI